MEGSAGSDSADYSDSSSGITIDLSLGATQNTVGAGIDTFDSIENVIGGINDDYLKWDVYKIVCYDM